MSKVKILQVEGNDIRLLSSNEEDNFFSLTDMARQFNDRPEIVIQNWIRNRNTIEFLGLWELLHNSHQFKHLEFEVIRQRAGLNSFALSVGQWTQATNAIGMYSKSGKYGGTFAHEDIALEFGSWLSPRFKLMLIKEFKRLKNEEEEEKKNTLNWSLKRMLSKVNYRIHTDAVKEHLIPPRIQNTKMEGIYFASEADLLNYALFGCTAKQWREANPTLSGNQRDYATADQLLVLANLENLNAEFIKQGMTRDERLQRLNEIAIHQMQIFMEIQLPLSLNLSDEKPSIGIGEKK